MAKRKKQKIEIPKKRYRLYCHKCNQIIESDEQISGCDSKCGVYTYTDHHHMTSQYLSNM